MIDIVVITSKNILNHEVVGINRSVLQDVVANGYIGQNPESVIGFRMVVSRKHVGIETLRHFSG